VKDIIRIVIACVLMIGLLLAVKYSQEHPPKGTRQFQLCRDTVVVTYTYGTSKTTRQIKLCRDTLVVLP
jgi:hypothetical protein